jgi:hypothetical protein
MGENVQEFKSITGIQVVLGIGMDRVGGPSTGGPIGQEGPTRVVSIDLALLGDGEVRGVQGLDGREVESHLSSFAELVYHRPICPHGSNPGEDLQADGGNVLEDVLPDLDIPPMVGGSHNLSDHSFRNFIRQVVRITHGPLANEGLCPDCVTYLHDCLLA